jgi:GTP-binding protein
MTNFRSNKELATVLAVPRQHTLDTAIEWIAQDELVEVTPKSVRIRKAVLDATARKRLERQLAAMTE